MRKLGQCGNRRPEHWGIWKGAGRSYQHVPVPSIYPKWPYTGRVSERRPFLLTVRVYSLYAYFLTNSGLIPTSMRDPYFDIGDLQYLFDSSGFWIAFRIDTHIFDPAGNLVGWLPFDDTQVHDTKGTYLGHIFPDNRLYRNKNFLKVEAIERPVRPRFVRIPVTPRNIARARLPIGCNDIRLSSHV